MPLRRLNFDNPWIEAVTTERGPARAWGALALGVLACAAAILFGRIAGERLAPIASARLPDTWSAIVSQAVFYLCVFTPLWATAICGGLVEGRRVWRAEPQGALAGAIGLLIGGIGYGLAFAMTWALGAIAPGATPPVASPMTGVMAGLVLVAFQAGGEEIFFRGWIQPVLCARLGPWVGLLMASGLFAALHLVGGVRSPLSVVNILLAGLLFGLLALRTGGIWAAFCAHLAWNWTETYGFGLDPNPGVNATGALVDMDLVGPGLWSGGADGMNGSLAATLVLAALVIGVVAAVRPANGAVSA